MAEELTGYHLLHATHLVPTVKEVATLFRASERTVIRWHVVGLLEGFKTPGGHRRIFRASVERYLRAERDQ